MDRRQLARKRQSCDLLAPPEHQIVGNKDESLRTGAFGGVEGWREVLRAFQSLEKTSTPRARAACPMAS